MQLSGIPTLIPAIWANAASSPYINPVPTPSQQSIANGRASFADGFPPNCFIPYASGGAGPFGGDTNGILQQITAGLQWLQAGGAVLYNSTFQTAIGGYPNEAIVQSATTPGLFWRSTADNNTSNPDTGGANWVKQFAQLNGDSTQVFNAAAGMGTNNVVIYGNAKTALAGVAPYAVSTVADLNAANLGWSDWNSATVNIPLSGSYGTVLTTSSTGSATPASVNGINQLAMANGGGVYTRQNINNVGWTAWSIISQETAQALSATTTLSAQQNNIFYEFASSSSTTATLPSAGGSNAGVTAVFFNNTAVTQTVACSANNLIRPGQTPVSSQTLAPYVTSIYRSDGFNWIEVFNSAGNTAVAYTVANAITATEAVALGQLQNNTVALSPTTINASGAISGANATSSSNMVTLGQLSCYGVDAANVGTSVTATISFTAPCNGYVVLNASAAQINGGFTNFTLGGTNITIVNGGTNFSPTSFGVATYLLSVVSGAAVTISMSAFSSTSGTIGIHAVATFLPKV